MNEHKEPIPSMIYNASVGGHVTNSQQIIDENENKEQSQINAEVKQNLGQGGSVDARISQAKNDIIGGASSNGNTLKKLEDRVSPIESAVNTGGNIDTRIKEAVNVEKIRAEKVEKTINDKVGILEDAVGTGGSIDSRISSAVDKETTRAQTEEANRYTKNETYTKEEVHNLITTPNQKYVSVIATSQTTSVTDILPTTGVTDTIYRIGNWNGIQYNDSVFSEYAWNGNAYIKLSTKSQVGEVYDISINHANTKYADLSTALGTNGENIPQSLRKGGISIKYIQSSDNKYAQYRLMSNTFNTNSVNWQGVEEAPTPYSKNLVNSNGIFTKIADINMGEEKIAVLSKNNLNGNAFVNIVLSGGYYYNFSAELLSGNNMYISVYDSEGKIPTLSDFIILTSKDSSKVVKYKWIANNTTKVEFYGTGGATAKLSISKCVNTEATLYDIFLNTNIALDASALSQRSFTKSIKTFNTQTSVVHNFKKGKIYTIAIAKNNPEPVYISTMKDSVVIDSDILVVSDRLSKLVKFSPSNDANRLSLYSPSQNTVVCGVYITDYEFVENSVTFTNPINIDNRNTTPDPYIISENGKYYLVFTSDKLPIYESSDMINWVKVGEILSDTDKETIRAIYDKDVSNNGVWAPNIVKYGDTFVCYYSVVNYPSNMTEACICCSIAKSMYGQWEYKGIVINGTDVGIKQCFDSEVAVMADGTPYMFVGSSYDIYALKLTKNGMSIVEGTTKQLIIRRGAVEASSLFYKDGFWYLLNSQGGHLTYKIKVCRSANILGPYLDKEGNQVIYSGGSWDDLIVGDDNFIGPGHNGPIMLDKDGNYWISYHAIPSDEEHSALETAHRKLMLQQVHFDEDGWPYVIGGVPSESQIKPRF